MHETYSVISLSASEELSKEKHTKIIRLPIPKEIQSN